MNCYEHNIQYLKRYRRNIYDELENQKLQNNTNHLEEVRSETAVNGEKYLLLKKNNRIYRLNSCYSPSHEAMKWSEQFSFTNINNVITMFGLGNGLFAVELLKKCKKEDFLFIYEPCLEIFLQVLEEYDITELLMDHNVILAVEGINDFDFHNLLQNAVNITNLFHQTQCSHPCYDEIFRESCVKYWKELKQNLVHARININTEILFGERLIRNGFSNMKYIKDSITLEELSRIIPIDVPAIIVSAGPSLRENIEELKRAKGRAYLFVVDRILDYILDNGIEPDFVVTIDPIKPVEYFTKRKDVTIPLLCEIVSNYEVLDQHKGIKVFYSCSPYFQKMYQAVHKTPPFLFTGTSVATAAFSSCIKMGFKKIVFVGQDLAYDGDYTHAGGVTEKCDSAQDLMVEGIDGKPVRSRYDWNEFLTWFKDMITLHPDIQVIDTKSRGAKIQGSVVMPLKEVIDSSREYGIDIKQTLQTKKTFDKNDLPELKKYFESSKADLEAIKKKAKEALRICGRQIQEYKRNPEDTEITVKNYQKISKINKFIGQKPSYFLLDTFITSLAANDISKLYQFTDDFNDNKIESYEKSKKIYEAIINATEYALPNIKSGLEKFEAE